MHMHSIHMTTMKSVLYTPVFSMKKAHQAMKPRQRGRKGGVQPEMGRMTQLKPNGGSSLDTSAQGEVYEVKTPTQGPILGPCAAWVVG